MMKILIRLFVKNGDITDKNVRTKYCLLASVTGVVLNIILFTVKYISGMVFGSVAITADAFNNLSDAFSSAVSVAGFKLAGKKPDKGHPYGHGRIEYVTGFAVALFILIMGFETAKASIEKIISPQNADVNALSVGILIFSIAVKLYMASYNKSIGKKINSPAILAAAADSVSDCAATSAVLVSMLIYYFAGVNIDGWCGVLVSLFIFKSGLTAAKETISPLLGQAPGTELVKRIDDIVLSHKEILGIHDLTVHDYGPGRFMISLHTEVNSSKSLVEIHAVIDSIEKELDEKLGCTSVIHIDPVEHDNTIEKEYKEQILETVKSIDSLFTVHDFHMMTGKNGTKLVFDVVMPYSYKMSDDEIKNAILGKIAETDDSITAVITIDKA